MPDGIYGIEEETHGITNDTILDSGHREYIWAHHKDKESKMDGLEEEQ